MVRWCLVASSADATNSLAPNYSTTTTTPPPRPTLTTLHHHHLQTLNGTVKVGDLGLGRELSEHTVEAHSKVRVLSA